ncbi:MAG: hypothetical protein ACI9JT_002692, partial [Polaribacter sp.]
MIRKLFLSVCVLLLTGTLAHAQKTVTGTVGDKDGPLPSASVIEKGTTNGVTTDFDGRFSIKVTDENAVLTITFIGYVDKDISVKGKTTLTIVLEEDAQT